MSRFDSHTSSICRPQFVLKVLVLTFSWSLFKLCSRKGKVLLFAESIAIFSDVSFFTVFLLDNKFCSLKFPFLLHVPSRPFCSNLMQKLCVNGLECVFYCTIVWFCLSLATTFPLLRVQLLSLIWIVSSIFFSIRLPVFWNKLGLKWCCHPYLLWLPVFVQSNPSSAFWSLSLLQKQKFLFSLLRLYLDY